MADQASATPRLRLLSERLREYVEFDSRVLRFVAALAGLVVGLVLRAMGRGLKSLSILAKVHRFAGSSFADAVVESIVRAGVRREKDQAELPRGVTRAALERHVADLARARHNEKYFDDPSKLLGARALVLKSPGTREKGVIVVDYSFTFPLFARLFDVQRIAESYHIVLEPTWAGYCDLDILCYCRFDFPVFVQSIEPRDNAFLRGLGSNLLTVPVAGNWWVDHRIMTPIPGVDKDVDFVFVAAWARYKRHARFFAALADLKRRGERPKVLLLGYPSDLTRDDVYGLARRYGVAEFLEMHEWLSPGEVNRQLNRAKVNVLWSRREGFNRAIIEGLFAGVPCILRDGHNYGHRYPYINELTGIYASEADLPRKLLGMSKDHASFSPRAWALEHMSCQVATRILGETIREFAVRNGERWTRDLVVKVTKLNNMSYWEEADLARFAGDFEFIRSMAREPALEQEARLAVSAP